MFKQRLSLSFSVLVSVLSITVLPWLSGCAGLGSQVGTPAQETKQTGPQINTFAMELRNSQQVAEGPYVILASIDGYRWDYNQKFNPPNLTAIANEGVAAEGLIPVYPSKTFPNHLSIITGLTADKHGIVANEFYDPSRDAFYVLKNRNAVQDGSWYQGETLWEAIEKQGGVTASFFFPGSEADIDGYHPNYWLAHDENVPNEARVKQVLGWLDLPEDRRPHFITLYFSEVDTANHRFGPDSDQVREAVGHVDQAMGLLREGLAKKNLPVNLIVVSDHGAEKLDEKKTIILDDFADLSKFRVVGRGPQMLLYLNKGENPKLVLETQKKLRAARGTGAKNFRVYRREELKGLKYDKSSRVGDLMIEVDPPWSVGTKAQPPVAKGGNHGWDPRKSKNMNGVFFAVGPAFKEKARMPAFENVNVYPLVLEVLGMKPLKPIDGKLSNVHSALRR